MIKHTISNVIPFHFSSFYYIWFWRFALFHDHDVLINHNTLLCYSMFICLLCIATEFSTRYRVRGFVGVLVWILGFSLFLWIGSFQLWYHVRICILCSWDDCFRYVWVFLCDRLSVKPNRARFFSRDFKIRVILSSIVIVLVLF